MSDIRADRWSKSQQETDPNGWRTFPCHAALLYHWVLEGSQEAGAHHQAQPFSPCICTWQSFKSLIETISFYRTKLWSSASTNIPPISKEWLTWVNCSWGQSLKKLVALIFSRPPCLLSLGEGRNQGANPALVAGSGGWVLQARWPSLTEGSPAHAPDDPPAATSLSRRCWAQSSSMVTCAQRDREATNPASPQAHHVAPQRVSRPPAAKMLAAPGVFHHR